MIELFIKHGLIAVFVSFSFSTNCNGTETRMNKKYNNETMIKTDSINYYTNVIKKIAEDIEAIKNQYPQLINFNSAINVDTVNLSISYDYKTHKSNQLVGWVAAVPNPDDDGIWFYIDFHSHDSQMQIHTQPLMPALCIGDKKVAFLILEGQKNQSIREHLNKILNNCGVDKCIINMKLTAQSLYFSTPQESVELTSKMLIEKDWGKLSRYYFVENSDKETIASLRNGSYFIRDKRPEVYHPAVNWKYKKPFPPNFKYFSHFDIENDSIKVNVSLEIDQGNDMMQSGMSTFYLIRSENGYQFLP